MVNGDVVSSEGIPSLTNSESGQGGEVIGDAGSGNQAVPIRFLTTTTDENGGKWLTYTAPQGWTTATVAPNNATTTFIYDALGQLLASTDPDTMTTTYQYDGFGHQIERNHPDAGTTKRQYDNAGNLIATQTQRQINDNTQTNYLYDYGRLIKTEYPLHPQLNVSYEYYSSTGGAGSTGGADGSSAQLRRDNSGCLKKRTDLTGSITYQYDELGNIRQEDRQIILPNEEKNYNFITRYEYDMLCRMISITYPDSENVNYTYQLGQLTTIQGDNQTLAQEMKYDEYDHLTQMTFGNGYKQSNTYNADRLWLQKIYTSNIFTSIGKRLILQDVDYGYDGVGNVVSKSEKVQVYPFASLTEHRASTSSRYEYDAANRLIESHGTTYETKLLPNTNYDYNITYSPSGMITNKTTTLNGVKTDLRYGYNVPLLRGQGGFTGFEGVSPSTDAVRNHQIKTIASKDDTTELTWDADGQLVKMRRYAWMNETDSVSGRGRLARVDRNGEATLLSTRSHLWNENGQLALFISDGGAGYYGYDANGERVYKLTGYTYKDNYNAGADTTRAYFNDMVLYVNPYFIVTPKGYTKHYYNGSDRLGTKTGNFENLPSNIVDSVCNNRAKDYFASLSNKPSADTTEPMHVATQCEENLLYPILSKTAKPSDFSEMVYYYHGDHLGSATWITDGDGDVVEHRRYLPYGETWYHKRFNESDYKERFTFTGKERDEESGYDYFGARYYDSRMLSGWMSVDPLWDKHQNECPYLYCAGNPMRLIDPLGLSWKATSSVDMDGNRSPNGFEWVDESKSYDNKGNLLPGLYHQAIFFSENGNYDANSKFNIGSSTATVYKEDGNAETFDACTYPSDPRKYPTIGAGLYEAEVGKHHGRYDALKMRDIGANSQTIELGIPNLAHPDKTFVLGANIHMAGYGNKTGIDNKNKAISEGCFLINIHQWDAFISIFTNSNLGGVVSIGVSRSLRSPQNKNIDNRGLFYLPRLSGYLYNGK